jgi:hypothetical protein
MDRRQMLKQLGLLTAGSLLTRVLDAVAAGTDLHAAPAQSALSAPQREMVAHLAEMIIPTTDTPGAAAAGVPAFIDRIVSTWYTDRERELFLAGLGELATFCTTRFSHDFNACTDAQRTEALTDAESRASGYRPSPAYLITAEPDQASPFFFKLKELTVLGYYSSEIGATKELAYNPVPGRYDGDYDLAKVGRQWSS